MTVLSDKSIRQLARHPDRPMIVPFIDPAVRVGVMSYGLSSCGYDLRLALDIKGYRMLVHRPPPQSKILTAQPGGKTADGRESFALDPQQLALQEAMEQQGIPIPLNPKQPHPKQIVDASLNPEGSIIGPGMMLVGRSVEYICMPEDILALGFGKSSYARAGILVNITPIEPGWEGHLTIAISNISDMPIVLFPNEGIAQLVFFYCDDRPDETYADRKGKYQASKGVVLSTVEPPKEEPKAEVTAGERTTKGGLILL